jgi:hypothetical protein
MEYFISIKVKMATFMGKASNAFGILIVDDIVVGSKELIFFFVIDDKILYSITDDKALYSIT